MPTTGIIVSNLPNTDSTIHEAIMLANMIMQNKIDMGLFFIKLKAFLKEEKTPAFSAAIATAVYTVKIKLPKIPIMPIKMRSKLTNDKMNTEDAVPDALYEY